MPDPNVVSAAQTKSNIDTATAEAFLNRVDQTTPWGASTWTTGGTNPDGTPRFAQNVSLAPAEQAQLDRQRGLDASLTDFASSQVGRLQDTMGKPFTFQGLPAQVAGVDRSSLPPLNPTIAPAGAQTSGYKRKEPVWGLDLTDTESFNLPTDFSADRQRVEDAIYGRATSRLDPQFGNRLNDIESRLTAMGIPRGSEAWNREMSAYERDKNDAYDMARTSAITGGGAEQSRLFEDLLRSRQQVYGEELGGKTFANEAISDYGQRELAASTLANQAQTQKFGQELARTSMANEARAQASQEALANAKLQNQARQQAIIEQAFERNLPINEIAALLGTTSGGVAPPTFAGVSATGVAPTDTAGNTWSAFNAQQAQYNKQLAAQQASMGGIFGMLGTGAGALLSDRRMKANIQRIGETIAGIPTYVFNYVGSRIKQFGVIAQEVMYVPEAVVNIDGILHVNYDKVWSYVR